MGLLAKLLKALNSAASPWQLAFGFALGMMMGLTPLVGLHSVVLVFLVLFFRVNISSFIIAWSLFSAIALLLNALFSAVGESILLEPSLQSVWNSLYSSVVGQMTQFYHTTTMGSLLIALLLFPFMLMLSKKLIEQYRQRFMQWVNRLPVVHFIKSTGFYQFYQTLGE
jgi:uncharacterized protein (TIGR03546 family)